MNVSSVTGSESEVLDATCHGLTSGAVLVDKRNEARMIGSAPTGEDSPFTTAYQRASSLPQSGGKLNREHMSRAMDLLDDIENQSAEQQTLSLEALRCTIAHLWSSAVSASQYHQSILSIVHMTLGDRECVDAPLAAALRGAFQDLSRQNLSEEQVALIRSHFIDVGYSPMSLIGDMGELEEAPPALGEQRGREAQPE